jgi:hypothetical protein
MSWVGVLLSEETVQGCAALKNTGYHTTHVQWSAWCKQSDKISHIDMGDDHINPLLSHIISPYPISISRMTMSIWWMTISINRVPYRYRIISCHSGCEALRR